MDMIESALSAAERRIENARFALANAVYRFLQDHPGETFTPLPADLTALLNRIYSMDPEARDMDFLDYVTHVAVDGSITSVSDRWNAIFFNYALGSLFVVRMYADGGIDS